MKEKRAIQKTLCYYVFLNRTKRYESMFNELGDSVLFNQEVINFKEIIRWSKRFLCKDDRIVWYLSVVRRLAFSCFFRNQNKS